MEPVHRSVINDTRELPRLFPEVLSHGREAQNELKVIPHLLEEIGIELLYLIYVHSLPLGLIPHSLDEGVTLVLRE